MRLVWTALGLLLATTVALAQIASGDVETLTATTTSATIASLITHNANNRNSWSTSAGSAPLSFHAQNFGSTDVAICIRGGTCSCLENGQATTNGTTVRAGSYFGFSGYGVVAYNVPTIVSCGGTSKVEIDH